MKRFLLFLFGFGLSVGLVACGSDTGSGLGPYGSFCGPVLAQMDSFTATFEGQEWPEERYGGMAVAGTVARVRGASPETAGFFAPAPPLFCSRSTCYKKFKAFFFLSINCF